MINEIKLFLFILCCIFVSRFIFEFVAKLFQENPAPLSISEIKKIFIYLSISYILTCLILF